MTEDDFRMTFVTTHTHIFVGSGGSGTDTRDRQDMGVESADGPCVCPWDLNASTAGGT